MNLGLNGPKAASLVLDGGGAGGPVCGGIEKQLSAIRVAPLSATAAYL